MNLDNSTPTNDTSAAEPAKKPRRRVVRTAGTPGTPGTPGTQSTPAAPAAEPATAPASAATTASQGATDAPASEAPKKATRTRAARTTAASDAATVAPEAAGEAPKRRSRAASRPAGAADAPAPAAAAPEAASSDAVAQEAPTKPARKRATRTAAPASDAASDAATAASVVDAAPEAAAPEAAAPARKRATRATKAAAAQADQTEQAERPEQTEGTPAPRTRRRATTPAADAAETVPAAPAAEPEQSTPPRTRSRRATRPAAAASTDEAQQAPQPQEADATVVTEAAPEKDAPARSARGRSRTARTAPVASDAPAEEAAAPRSARTTRRAASAAPVAEPVGTEAPQEEAAETRLPMTALLFQAPDPAKARARRRRVSAPAGPPEAVVPVVDEEAEELEADETVAEADAAAVTDEVPSTDDVDTDESEQDEQDDQDDQDGEQAAGQRRRRRRGGRGRRRSSQGAEASDEQGAEASDEQGAEASDEQDGADDAAASSDSDTAADAETPDEVEQPTSGRRRRSRGRSDRSRTEGAAASDSDESDENDTTEDAQDAGDTEAGSSSRRRRRRRSGRGGEGSSSSAASTAEARVRRGTSGDEVTALKGSTRLEAKRQRRREGRDAGRRRSIITEAEFLARRESVERSMVVREKGGRTQIAVLEDGVLVEHYVSQQEQVSMAGNVYLGRVQNVLPSMEAAFIDVGKGRNAVLYAGEVNWDAAGLEGQPRRIEQALKSGDSVLVQVTKDPIGHKGARLTSQITLAGRYLVYVPGGGMTGISRKLPDTERARLKKILKEVVPDHAGVIVRTAAEGASESELRADVARLQDQWAKIEKKAKTASAPSLLQGEPDLAIRVVRDIFNDDFSSLVVQGDTAWDEVSGYVGELAPDLAERVTRWTQETDVFAQYRVDEQLAKGMDRKVWLPSGGSLVIDRTEAMTVVDVNTGKFTGSGGTLEETVTRNNLEAAEEIVRQLRLRDIGGIIVIDFIDMVLESNRDLVLRRLVECLGRDRTKHQVAEVTSLGLVQMTRKRVGQGLVEAFSTTCEHCNGRGFIVHAEPNEKNGNGNGNGGASEKSDAEPKRSRRKRGGAKEEAAATPPPAVPVLPENEARQAVKATLATIAAAAAHAHHDDAAPAGAEPSEAGAPAEEAVADARVDDVAGAQGAPEVAVDVVTVEVEAPQEPAIAVPAEPVAPAAPLETVVTDVEPEGEAPVLDVLAELASVRRAPRRAATPSASIEELTVPGADDEAGAPRRRRSSSRGRSTRAAGAPRKDAGAEG